MKKINFAQNLKNLRISANLKQKDLANALGVDQRTVSAWENEICEPDFNTLAKICELFNETFDNILT